MPGSNSLELLRRLKPSVEGLLLRRLKPSAEGRQFRRLKPSVERLLSRRLKPSVEERQFRRLKPSVEERQFRRLKPSVIFLFSILFAGIQLYSQQKYRPGTDGKYPSGVFVVTNRVIDTLSDGRLIFSNNADTAGGLKFFKVSYEEGGWNGLQYNGFEDLLGNRASYRDWAIWVHGDGQSFLLSMKIASEIQQLHQVNLIVFSWPTKAPDKGEIANFKNSLVNSGLTVPAFAQMLAELENYREMPGNELEGDKVTIFFHSLGNSLLKLAVEGGYLNDIQQDIFNNLVINEAATDSHGHAGWIEKLNFQDRIYITFNGSDMNLRGLRILTKFDTQLGEQPLPPYAKNAVYVDFTNALANYFTPGTTHSFYYARVTEQREVIRKFYTDLFQGKEIDLNDEGTFESGGAPGIVRIKF